MSKRVKFMDRCKICGKRYFDKIHQKNIKYGNRYVINSKDEFHTFEREK